MQMADMEETLNTILSNPQMMQNIMAMAQSLGQTPSKAEENPQTSEIDFSMLQKLGSLSGQTGIDPQQRALLSALGPYLTRSRIAKLEKAMRAAKMAKLASAFVNAGGLQLLTGR
jgi:hydroxymethylglutaryl-CoA reductase